MSIETAILWWLFIAFWKFISLNLSLYDAWTRFLNKPYMHGDQQSGIPDALGPYCHISYSKTFRANGVLWPQKYKSLSAIPGGYPDFPWEYFSSRSPRDPFQNIPVISDNLVEAVSGGRCFVSVSFGDRFHSLRRFKPKWVEDISRAHLYWIWGEHVGGIQKV